MGDKEIDKLFNSFYHHEVRRRKGINDINNWITGTTTDNNKINFERKNDIVEKATYRPITDFVKVGTGQSDFLNSL